MPRTGMTGFGRQVWTLMASRGVTTQRELSRRILVTSGHAVSFHAVRNYLFGRSGVPSTFPGQVAEALDLDGRERSDLAMAYAYGQGAVASETERAAC